MPDYSCTLKHKKVVAHLKVLLANMTVKSCCYLCLVLQSKPGNSYVIKLWHWIKLQSNVSRECGYIQKETSLANATSNFIFFPRWGMYTSLHNLQLSFYGYRIVRSLTWGDKFNNSLPSFEQHYHWSWTRQSLWVPSNLAYSTILPWDVEDYSIGEKNKGK